MDNEQINTDDESSDDEQKKTKINSPIKNLLQPIPIVEHSPKIIEPLHIDTTQIKSKEEPHLSSPTTIIKTNTPKKVTSIKKSNSTIPNIIQNSVPHFISSK
jgi:hypothetical protein